MTAREIDTEQAARDERWRRMTEPRERSTGKLRWLQLSEKNAVDHDARLWMPGARVLQQEWEISEWSNGAWRPYKIWRDVPVVDE